MNEIYRGVAIKVIIVILNKIKDANGGNLLPRAVWKAAEKPSHPLHQVFEWADAKCGRLHRDHQARILIERAINPDVMDRPKRTYTHVRIETEDGFLSCYRETEEVMAEPELRAQMVLALKREMEAAQGKLFWLPKVAKAIGKVIEELDKEI